MMNLEKNQKTVLSTTECLQFLRLYLEGIFDEGLLAPLEILSEQAGAVGLAASSFYSLQLNGLPPERALREMNPCFSTALTDVLVLGFEKSVLDLAIADILRVYKATQAPDLSAPKKIYLEVSPKELQDLVIKYSAIQTQIICADCWQDELQKIMERAKNENATKVFLSQENNEFFVQKYQANKFVRMKEAAIPAVYLTLKDSLTEFAELEKTLPRPGEDMNFSLLANSGVLVQTKSQNLQIIFES